MKKVYTAIICMILTLSVTASASVIWENKTENIITKGVTHKYIEKFTDTGWEKINVLEIELKNDNLSLRAMYDETGIKNLKTLGNMAKTNKVAAAVNADFFNFSPSNPLGLTVNDGEIISSASRDTGLAAFVETDEGNVFMDYFRTQLFAVAPDGDKNEIIYINKYHSMQSMVMYTNKWGEYSPGSKNGVIELVAQNGKVTEIREDMPGVKIPDNGYVLATDSSINTFFKDNFEVGDDITLEILTTPDYGNIKTAVGGGTILVSKGKVFSFTNNIGGNNPRTAAGINRSGDKLYLVTVDGRQNYTPGMTQMQLAQLMIELGAYNAINFDGGGSTTMVARDRNGDIKTLNTPSGGAQRAIATGLGISADYPVGKLSGFDVMLSSNNVFAGDRVSVWVSPFDEFNNQYIMGDEIIEYSSSGTGDFENNIYFPENEGRETITVSCGDAMGQTVLNVLGKAENLSVYPPSASIGAGQSATLVFTGKDKNGYEAYVSGDEIKFKVISGKASYKDGKITSTDGKNAVVKFTKDNGSVYMAINGSLDDKYISYENDDSRQNIDKLTFAVLPGTLKVSTFMDVHTNKQIEKNRNIAGLSYTYGIFSDSAISINKFSSENKNGNVFMTISNKGGSIRTADSSQWSKLQSIAENTPKNLFIMLSDDISSFKDTDEKALFENILSKRFFENGTQVFVIYPSDKSNVTLKNGVRYISLKKIPKIHATSMKKDIENAVYLGFKITNDGVKYQFMPITSWDIK